MLVFISGAVSLLAGSSYPVLDREFSPQEWISAPIDTEMLSQFLVEWTPDETGDFSSIQNEIQVQNRTVRTLESVAAIQEVHLDRVKSDTNPKISINSTPQTPVYGFVQNTSLNTSSSPPVTVLLTSHSVGLTGAVSKNLMSGGNMSLDLSSVSSVSTVDGGNTWTWRHSPSFSFSVSQPLGINDKIIDFRYRDASLEAAKQVYHAARQTVDLSVRELTVESLSLLQRYQRMKEQRYVNVRSAELQKLLYERAQQEEAKGQLSRDDLRDQYLLLSSASLEVEGTDREIASIERSLKRFALSKDGRFEQFPEITMGDIEKVISFYGNVLTSDPFFKEQFLLADEAYTSALLDYQSVLISRAQGSPADAPVVSLALNYSPFSTPAVGSTFTDSFADLFSSSTDHNVSVSVMFNSNDVFRGEKKRIELQLAQQALQAELEVERAREEVESALEALQLQINQSIDTLAQRIDDYVLTTRRLEHENIRNTYGVSDTLRLEQSEIAMYRSAFALLDSLRTLYVLGKEISLTVY